MKLFLETTKDIFAIGSALLILAVFAAWHPTGDFVSSPSYWVDEAISVEKARNFLELGKLDVVIAPGVVSGKLYATSAAGPLLTLPLAGFLGTFGVGIAQVRVYMFLWLVILLCVSYFFARNIFGRRAAFFAIVLMATFSPLYANGKTATGDIPGFVALLCALYYLYVRKWYVFSGILFGIAAITKPSLYIFVSIIAILEILLSESQKRLTHAIALLGGGLMVLMPWIISLPSHLYDQSSWEEVYTFFGNPFPQDAITVLASLGMGDSQSLLHSTVIYYIALMAVISFAILVTRDQQHITARIMRFSLLFTITAFILYLRSPGWLRYLLAGTLLLFFVLPAATQIITYQRRWRYAISFRVGIVALIVLIGAQTVHFFFFSWRTASGAIMRDSVFLQQLLKTGETIGFVDVPAVASLFDSHQKFQVMRISGNTVLGVSPLAYSADMLPNYIFIPYNRFGDAAMREFVDPYMYVLERHYSNYTPPHARYVLYKKIL